MVVVWSAFPLAVYNLIARGCGFLDSFELAVHSNQEMGVCSASSLILIEESGFGW